MATSAVPMKMSKSIERNLAEVAPTAVKAMDSAKSLVASSYEKATVYAKAAKVKTMVVVKDKTFQVTAASAAGGAAACGATGATVGMVTGGAIGAMVGVVPALLTFGLSIPAGAAIGGGCGAMAGATTGGTVGAVGGGAAGYGAFTRREKISAKGRQIYAQAMAAVSGARAKGLKYKADAVKLVEDRVATTKAKALAAFGAAKAKTTERATAAKAKSIEIASNKTVQVTAASATGGAVVLGAGGAATGLAAGGTIGAAIGVIPALFTFGLSIPVGAMIGGGCGLVAGTAVGSTTGLVVGGTTGSSFRDLVALGVEMKAYRRRRRVEPDEVAEVPEEGAGGEGRGESPTNSQEIVASQEIAAAAGAVPHFAGAFDFDLSFAPTEVALTDRPEGPAPGLQAAVGPGARGGGERADEDEKAQMDALVVRRIAEVEEMAFQDRHRKKAVVAVLQALRALL